MECRFGYIIRKKMILNDFGKIAYEEWLNLPMRFQNVELHVIQIMPNHMHAIIELRRDSSFSGPTLAGASPASTNNSSKPEETCVQEGLAPSVVKNSIPISQAEKDLSQIIGSYKSIVANNCLHKHKAKYNNMPYTPLLGKIWKRSFYDHIFFDQFAFKAISRYIRDNPKKWIRK